MADDVIWRDVALGMPLQGRAALLEAVQAYMTAFPDLRIEVSSYTIDGPRLVQEWMSTGTHQGELMGMAPTGRWIENYGALVTTCDDAGLVIEGAVYWNPLAMFRQLGLEPPVLAPGLGLRAEASVGAPPGVRRRRGALRGEPAGLVGRDADRAGLAGDGLRRWP